jgi:hypothetical protein
VRLPRRLRQRRTVFEAWAASRANRMGSLKGESKTCRSPILPYSSAHSAHLVHIFQLPHPRETTLGVLRHRLRGQRQHLERGRIRRSVVFSLIGEQHVYESVPFPRQLGYLLSRLSLCRSLLSFWSPPPMVHSASLDARCPSGSLSSSSPRGGGLVRYPNDRSG